MQAIKLSKTANIPTEVLRRENKFTENIKSLQDYARAFQEVCFVRLLYECKVDNMGDMMYSSLLNVKPRGIYVNYNIVNKLVAKSKRVYVAF